jgi:hypothetical protein
MIMSNVVVELLSLLYLIYEVPGSEQRYIYQLFKDAVPYSYIIIIVVVVSGTKALQMNFGIF